MKKTNLITAITVMGIIFTMTFAAEAAKKKLFINRLEAGRGVSGSLTEKMRDYMTLSVLENYRSDYTTITDDDIKIMYQKAADLMSAGCSADKCVQQIGDAIDADEIIYGKVESDGGKLAVSMKNLVRDRESLSISTKSFVKISFFESQVEWFSKEIAKKLIRPRYEIDRSKAPSVVAGGFKVEKIDLKTTEGLGISELRFESRDKDIIKYIDYFKKLVEKGDRYFKNGEYEDALVQYKETLSKIENRLSSEKRREISSFTQDVEKRAAAVYERELKKKLDEIDGDLKGSDDLDMGDLNSGEEKYRSVRSSYNKIENRFSRWLTGIEEAITSRLNSVHNAMANLKEKEGDSWYGEYKFQKAIDAYREGLSLAKKSSDPDEKLKETRRRLGDKARTTKRTGTSWLENQMYSYCDQAEYLNVRDRTAEAQAVMEKAGYMLSAHKEFSNAEIETKYEKTCALVRFDSSSVESDVAILDTSSSSFYLTGTVISWGLTAGIFGTGYLFDTKVAAANDDYDAYSEKYDKSTNFSEASRLHKDMESAHEDAEKYALYRNITYGIGAAALAGAVYFTYKYMIFRSVESRIEEEISGADDVLFLPVYAGGRAFGGVSDSRGQDFYGGVVIFRM